MSSFGIAIMIIVVLVGIGMFFTGYSLGMQWVITNLQIEVLKVGRNAENSDGADGNHNDQ